MLDRLPNFIDPLVFADRQRQLTGEIALNNFSRLSDLLSDDNGKVTVDLFFSKIKRLAIVHGNIKVTVKIECQSCLATMDLLLDVPINLAFVESLDEADKLAGEYEPFVLKEKKISLNQLIEDELLLALPDFPRHQHVCFSYVDETTNDKTVQPNNPFAILAQLKNTGDQ